MKNKAQQTTPQRKGCWNPHGWIAVDGIEVYDGFHRIARSLRQDAVAINGYEFKTA